MTQGLEIRKLHTGLPKVIIDMLTYIVANDFNGVQIQSEGNKTYEGTWNTLAKSNDFETKIEEFLRDICTVGDGAFKLSYDSEISEPEQEPEKKSKTTKSKK